MSTNAMKVAPWIQTYKGLAFDFEEMESNHFDPSEVAKILARVPRFSAHTKWKYSVAQHCVLVARKVYHPGLQLAALLHDATEAYIGDISAPVKHWLRDYGKTDALRILERRIWEWIAREHRMDVEIIEDIRRADLTALATEARDLMHDPPKPWIELPPPWRERIEPWSEEYAEDEWKRMYLEVLP